jgi:putative ABC transport system permease protein
MASYISGFLGEMYGVGERAQELTANPSLLATALVIGVVTSVVAAVIPARNAARIDPVKALQKGRSQLISAGENRVRRVLAVITTLAAFTCLAISDNRYALYAGYLLAIVASVLISPTVTALLSRALRPVLKLINPVEGALAADSLLQAPRRTSGTVAALMLSLALVIGLAGIAKASYMSITNWLNTALNPDLFVTASESPTRRSFRLPASFAKDLVEVSGVDEAQPVRSGRIQIKGKPVMLVAADVRRINARARQIIIEGDSEDMLRRVSAGRAANISESLASLQNFKRGDTIEIPSPTGVLRLPIAGIVTDYSDQNGSVIIDRSVYVNRWRDDSVNIFRVYTTRGVDPETVKQRILDRFGNRTRLFVMTNGDLKSYILGLTDQWFGLTYVQIAVAVLVAILGIVNTLTVSITDRRRELGVLQAVGAMRNQVRRTVWIEAVAIAFIGIIMGLAFGAVQLYYSLNVTMREFAGYRLTYEYPFAIAAALFPIMFAVGLISALGPAESAVRGSLVEALEYE